MTPMDGLAILKNSSPINRPAEGSEAPFNGAQACTGLLTQRLIPKGASYNAEN